MFGLFQGAESAAVIPGRMPNGMALDMAGLCDGNARHAEQQCKMLYRWDCTAHASARKKIILYLIVSFMYLRCAVHDPKHVVHKSK